MNLAKFLVLALSFSFALSAQDCKQIYKEKGEKREKLNSILLIGAAVGVSTASSAGIIMLAGPAVIGGAAVTTGAQVGVYSLYATAIGSLAGIPSVNIKNKFEKIEEIITASQDNRVNNKQFQKMVKGVRALAIKESCDRINQMNDAELNNEVRNLIIESNQNDALCPLVDHKGQPKRALFNRKSLSVFIKNSMC